MWRRRRRRRRRSGRWRWREGGREGANLRQVERTRLARKYQRQEVAAQRCAETPASSDAVEGIRPCVRRLRADSQVLHPACSRGGRTIVARRTTYPQLKWVQPILAAVEPIEDHDLLHCCIGGQLDGDPRIVLRARVAKARRLCVVDALGSNVIALRSAQSRAQARELEQCAQRWQRRWGWRRWRRRWRRRGWWRRGWW